MPAQGADRVNPREVFDRAMGMPELSPDELATFNTLRAREMARAEARRQPPQPQLDLPEAA